jgi:hypothetical protein
LLVAGDADVISAGFEVASLPENPRSIQLRDA